MAGVHASDASSVILFVSLVTPADTTLSSRVSLDNLVSWRTVDSSTALRMTQVRQDGERLSGWLTFIRTANVLQDGERFAGFRRFSHLARPKAGLKSMFHKAPA